MNVAIVNISSGGTLGHQTLHKRLKEIYCEHNIFVFSEFDGSLPSQGHTPTVGGVVTHVASGKIRELCQKHRIQTIIFSTFFDPELVKTLKEDGIETILISYPLRSSYYEYNLLKKYYEPFTKIIFLEDLIPINCSNKAKLYDTCEGEKNNKSRKQILITCGGGGRPSGEKFLAIVNEKLIPIIESKKINYKLIKGPYNNSQLSVKNEVKFVENMDEEYANSICVISEGGFYTLQELSKHKVPGFIIPGARRTDDQELRGVWFEKLGRGVCSLPEDENIDKHFLQFLDNLESYHFEHNNNNKTLKEVLLDD